MRLLKAFLACGLLGVGLGILAHACGGLDGGDRFLPWAVGQPPAPLWAQWVGAAFVGLGLGWTSVAIRSVSLRLAVAGVALLEVVGLSWVIAVAGGGYWAPWASLLAGGVALLAGLGWSRSAGGRRRDLLETLFTGRVAPERLRQWVDSDEPLPLAGERREASLVVCEMFNQNILAQELAPEASVALTNGFLKAAADTLLRAGGMLETCGGERVRALFGLPLSDEAHATRACEAALLLGEALEAFCQRAQEEWGAVPDYRIAVHAGEVIAAAYGAGGVGGFSVTGEALEFSRKLCLANTFYGSRILLGPRVHVLAGGAVEVRPMELIRLPGQRAPEEIYELLAPAGGLDEGEAQRREMFWKGVILFREQRFEEAAGHFQAIVNREGGEDAPVRFYLERIEHARESSRSLDWELLR